MDAKTIILPHINLNGTSAEMLAEHYREAYVAVEAAIDQIVKIEFHARDYMQQPNGHEIWTQARGEYIARLQKLKDVSDDLLKLAMHAQDHVKS